MELCDIKEVGALLARHGFTFQKSKGQNFLIDPRVPERIARESGAGRDTGVLEIGPGVGCLTQELCLRAGRVVALEVDERLVPVLRETVGHFENLTVLRQDVMKADVAALVEEYFPGLSPAVCANLPYNITSPVLTKLIGSGLFGSITVMIQREVAMRICARPGTADYGAFGIYVNFYTVPERLFDVPPQCFQPSPRVTSSVIRLTRRERPAEQVNEQLFFRVVRAAFNQRRKTLENALAAGFSGALDKAEAARAVLDAGLPAGVRGEALDMAAFAALTRQIERRI